MLDPLNSLELEGGLFLYLIGLLFFFIARFLSSRFYRGPSLVQKDYTVSVPATQFRRIDPYITQGIYASFLSFFLSNFEYSNGPFFLYFFFRLFFSFHFSNENIVMSHYYLNCFFWISFFLSLLRVNATLYNIKKRKWGK